MRKKTNALTTCLPPPLPATAMNKKKFNEMSLNLHSSYEKEEKHLTQPNQAQPAQLRPGSQAASQPRQAAWDRKLAGVIRFIMESLWNPCQPKSSLRKPANPASQAAFPPSQLGIEK